MTRTVPRDIPCEGLAVDERCRSVGPPVVERSPLGGYAHPRVVDLERANPRSAVQQLERGEFRAFARCPPRAEYGTVCAASNQRVECPPIDRFRPRVRRSLADI